MSPLYVPRTVPRAESPTNNSVSFPNRLTKPPLNTPTLTRVAALAWAAAHPGKGWIAAKPLESGVRHSTIARAILQPGNFSFCAHAKILFSCNGTVQLARCASQVFLGEIRVSCVRRVRMPLHHLLHERLRRSFSHPSLVGRSILWKTFFVAVFLGESLRFACSRLVFSITKNRRVRNMLDVTRGSLIADRFELFRAK